MLKTVRASGCGAETRTNCGHYRFGEPAFSQYCCGDFSVPQVFVLLPPLEEFDAPVYDQVHQEQIVAGEMTLNIVENPVVQERVIVQENSELQVMERIQEQIVETTKEVPWERVQQRTVEQIVRMPVPQIQEQVIVLEIPQVVDSFLPLEEFVALMCNL